MAKHFYKYHGTGNDFIMIDNRRDLFKSDDVSTIKHLCEHHTGIGADGLILLNDHPDYPFEMKYYNADGKEGTLCGNGSRCAVLFAKHLGIITNSAVFLASDGEHRASLSEGDVQIEMCQTALAVELEGGFFINTGSPHLVVMVSDLEQFDVALEGQLLRYQKAMMPDGTNVNFVESLGPDSFSVRTYERGVERETLSCGTGAVATALTMYQTKRTKSNKVIIKMKGGELEIGFNPTSTGFEDITLKGPARYVFKGEWS